ncbi:hypothetical protein M8R20_46140 [Pseudomonas sp. R2.Fl]|nr:hypothetical protein [Pseudomonas sp. R2.Fl]MCL6714372.1 hypothetical protein [Pseudomonas sp. R2.Fl]
MPTPDPIALPELPYELEVLAARLYADAYQAGHDATVEGEFIDLHPNDRDTYWLDRLREHEDVLAYAALAHPADGDFVLVPREALDWLNGEGEEGFECPPGRYFRGEPPRYWWRSVFREKAGLSPAPSTKDAEER